MLPPALNLNGILLATFAYVSEENRPVVVEF